MSRTKTLDEKLKRIHADPHGCKDFILADAKDADMALAIGATGRTTEKWPDGSPRFRTLAEYRKIIEEIVEQGLVDIMLMSASTSEELTIRKRIFDNSAVTPACRGNDTTDIHVFRGGKSPGQPSLPFRPATIDHIQCGKLHCSPADRHIGANLGLYSITYTNDPVRDREALLAYNAFRLEAEEKGFRHFLEVFDPNVEGMVAPEHLGGFINDAIVRTLGGVTRSGRPDFLKIVYHGPRAMETGGVRPPLGGGHPGWLGRHHLRRIQATGRGEKIRREGGLVLPQDQPGRKPARLHPFPAVDRRRRNRAGRGREGLPRRAASLGCHPQPHPGG